MRFAHAKWRLRGGRRLRWQAFSLMEVIVATAVLAAAGAALVGLIGQASRLGLQAQRRSDALQAATTVLEEAIGMRGRLRSGETRGAVAGSADWQFEMRCEPFRGVAGGRPVAGAAAGSSETRVMRVTVEIFPRETQSSVGSRTGSKSPGGASGERRGVVRLVRLIRVRTAADSGSSATGAASAAATEFDP
jgi:Tfp pilus assembly protein PilV